MKVLNLAAGNRIAAPQAGLEIINHDRWAHRPEINAVWDLGNTPWPGFDGEFGRIIAFDVLEHLSRPLTVIEELWRISAHEAYVYVHTAWAGPHIDNRHVWRDPTHIRPFTEESFDYFDPDDPHGWHSQYGKFYSPARFRITRIDKEPPDCIGFHLIALKESTDSIHSV